MQLGFVIGKYKQESGIITLSGLMKLKGCFIVTLIFYGMAILFKGFISTLKPILKVVLRFLFTFFRTKGLRRGEHILTTIIQKDSFFEDVCKKVVIVSDMFI